MHIVALVLVLGIGGLFLGAAIASLFVRFRESRPRRVVRTICTLLMIYGGFAFFAPALAVSGPFLVPDVEWPVGLATGVVRDTRGRYIVPHTPSGRVQVYDADRHFERGWSVAAAGGIFKLRVTDEDNIEVFTARRQRRFLFDPDGTLLEEGPSPQPYSDISTGPTASLFFPTPWYLWPLAHPAIGWSLLVVGIVGVGSLARCGRRPGPVLTPP